ncbi:MAG: DUF1080 domain-containing protein [Ferruginibacter sp.]
MTAIKSSLLLIILFCIAFTTDAQKTADIKKAMIFSAVKGTVSKPDSVTLPAGIKSVGITGTDSSAFKILPGKTKKTIVVFTPAIDFTGIAKAVLQLHNAANKPVLSISLTGLAAKGIEGENEVPLSVIVTALGYQANIGWSGLANNTRPVLQGDELASSLFHKAGKGNVEIIPVARYSPDFELPFGYYTDSAEAPQIHETGILAKKGSYPEHQTLFPAMASGKNSFNPGNNDFGFYATGPTHIAYSEDVWNMLYYPANAVHATRIYPLKNAAGKLIANTYLLCFEEAKNGDYNDYVFLVKNIMPVNKDLFTVLFNGKNLEGWHTYLRNIGKNKDPENNFRIEDSALHVIGKNLGYAMTDKAYSNYHFKVDFKFGERRWPPRDTAKRDGGVCYNIPVNEPDSIWPQSIECQIQEGDVGDFWLLGFSTIKVKGVQNKPANHTRMIKYADGEKPTGQWNSLEIISYNGKCVQIVNGVIVNVGEEASIKSGRILLQSEYAEIYYRNVRIRKL